jgi:hypothetical protein
MARGAVRDSELRLIAHHCIEPGSAHPLGLYVLGPEDPAAELTRHVERTVFYEAFGDTPELLAKEYDPYEDASLFFCVVDQLRKLPVGAGRIVVPAPGGPGLKTINDIPAVWGVPAEEMIERSGLAMDLARTWDVATLAVMPEYRRSASAGLVSAALYHAGLRSALRCGIELMIAILDEPVFEMARIHFHAAFTPLGGAPAKQYMGSARSYPVWIRPGEWVDRVRQSDPAMYDFLVEGEGLREMMRLPDWDDVAGLVAEVSRPRPAAVQLAPTTTTTTPARAGSGERTPAPEAVTP